MATALVLGATGLVGSHLLPLLLEAAEYDHVTALTRRPQHVSHPKLEFVECELAEVDEHAAELQADDIYCALGTTIRQAQSQEAFRAVDHDAPLAISEMQIHREQKRFMLVSALGADPDSFFFYSKVKADTERDLGSMGYKKLYIARPSMLLGGRAEWRMGEKLGEWASAPLAPLMRGPWRKYRPIQAQVVAENLLRIMRGQEPRDGMEYALIGPNSPSL